MRDALRTLLKKLRDERDSQFIDNRNGWRVNYFLSLAIDELPVSLKKRANKCLPR